MVAAVRATNITGGFLHGMPRRKGCTWLDAYPLNKRPPLTRLLERSVYYPASGTDWRPMQYLHPHFGSYLYSDYGMERERIRDAVQRIPGFTAVGVREVTAADLGVRKWAMPQLQASDGTPDHRNDFTKPFFGLWVILESPRRERTSLLYLCEDGVRIYHTLYVACGVVPACIALIQPGHAFGGNWTNFFDPAAPLRRCVSGNTNGPPQFLVHGGIGDPASYRNACWTEYRELISPLEPGLNLWRKADQ